MQIHYPSNASDDHEIQLADSAHPDGWQWRWPGPVALPVTPGDVTLLLNDPLHACSSCAKQDEERILALCFYRLAPQHREEEICPPSAAHLTGELSSRESRGMANSFRRGFSFELSRELFSGTDYWRNITNYFVAKRQRKHVNSSLVRPGSQLLARVSPAVDRTLREMTSDTLGSRTSFWSRPFATTTCVQFIRPYI